MPTFDILPLNEARANSATGQRAALLQEYMGYIQRVGAGQAGKLEPGDGETTQAVRRRLAAAGGSAGEGAAGPPLCQRCLLLGAGGPAALSTPNHAHVH